MAHSLTCPSDPNGSHIWGKRQIPTLVGDSHTKSMGVFLYGFFFCMGVFLYGGVFALGCFCIGVFLYGVFLYGGVFIWGCFCMGVFLHGGVFVWRCFCMAVFLYGGAHQTFWKEPLKRYQESVLWAWLEIFVSPKSQFLHKTLSPVIFCKLNILKPPVLLWTF